MHLQVRSISESKDEFSNGSATNSAVEDEEDDDDERDGTIRLSNRQFVFDLKQLNGFSGGQSVGAARERVRVERLSRNFEPALDVKSEVHEVLELRVSS